MKVAILGSGGTERELLEERELPEGMTLQPWDEGFAGDGVSTVVHEGSGHELARVMELCDRTQATLLELSTGSVLKKLTPSSPVVLCPDMNILVLKFRSVIDASGSSFRDYQVSIQESHNGRKTSAPCTARALAYSLGLPPDSIESVREAERHRLEFAGCQLFNPVDVSNAQRMASSGRQWAVVPSVS